MTDITPINSQPAARIESPGRTAAGRTEPEASASSRVERGADRADTDPLNAFLQRLRETGVLRVDLINDVRSQIEAGTYDTPEKLDAALNEMIDDEIVFG
ncbi:MAG: hypothetical protein EA423_06910 [Phycisphaerales bacterium]|nr:MAG: hypothetical protein EA423_06910 [Phycisphaerales bacterium]